MRQSVNIVLLVLLSLVTFHVASPGVAEAKDVIDHSTLDALLKKYVDKQGRVDYAGLKEKEEDHARLKRYLSKVATAEPKGSKKARLAFYINAYNATVLASVIEKYPIDSVMKVDGFFKKEKHKIAGQEMTLDHLEHGLIRKKFNEPRIHFVLVCAAKSCPRLQRKAATEKNVEQLMESAAKEFIPQATKVDGKTVTTSKLFEWFADDFKKGAGSVEKYLAKYLPQHASLLKSKDVALKFSHYDWDLNKK